MIGFISPSKDVYFNLAAEEYFLKSCREEVAFFYLNDPCVVVGKHQNALAESDYPFLMKNNIPLARRLSGGGTVFHDEGNINFSFIRNFTENAKSVDFKGFLDPVLEFLRSKSIPAEYSNRNDLLVEGKKFSGNAEHVHQQGKRTLHHGTILFDSALDKLGKAITNIDKRYTHKAVASVRSQVANVSPYLSQPMSILEFTQELLKYFLRNEQITEYLLSDTDLKAIESLKQEKFSTWEWNIAYSPKYNMECEWLEGTASYDLKMAVVKGVVKEFSLFGHPMEKVISKIVLDEKLHWETILEKGMSFGLDRNFVQFLTERLF